MANEIYREIFVTREEYTPPIQYVQAANAIPIVARICDYNIPSGAKANVYIKKPSGKSVQDTAVIDGNTVTIDVKTQMFAEIGMSIMQIQITNGQDVLLTFDLPVMVRKNRTEPGAPESENEAAFFTELQEAANKARIAAQEANNAAQAAEDALSVLEGAVEGTIINDDTPSDVTTFSGRHIENTFLEKNGDGGNVIVTFQQAADRAGIESGDSLAVAFGKLAKFFTDIQSYVFSPPVNNLLSTDTSRPLSAAMGKQLQEAVESINSALAGFKFVDSVSTGDNGSTSMTMTQNLEGDNLYLVFVRHFNGPVECYPPYIHYICVRNNAWNYTTIGEPVSPDSMSIEGGKLTLRFAETQWAKMWVYKVS